MDFILLTSLIIFLTSMSLVIVRLALGPTAVDKVLAVDLMSYIGCVIALIISTAYELHILAIASFTLALWAFVLTLYTAKYIEARDLGD